MNHNLKEKMLPDCYEYSQSDVAEKLFLDIKTVRAAERSAIQKFKVALAERGLTMKDFL